MRHRMIGGHLLMRQNWLHEALESLSLRRSIENVAVIMVSQRPTAKQTLVQTKVNVRYYAHVKFFNTHD